MELTEILDKLEHEEKLKIGSFFVELNILKDVYNFLIDMFSRVDYIREVDEDSIRIFLDASNSLYYMLTFTASTDKPSSPFSIDDKFSISLWLLIAAVYTEYTIDTVMEHVREIEIFNNKYTTAYLKVIKEFNKNIPDNLRLWLELYV